jgi:hypothetical protein
VVVTRTGGGAAECTAGRRNRGRKPRSMSYLVKFGELQMPLDDHIMG